MNVEFVAIIVGIGVAIALVAVVAELMALRSSVNRSAAAVKDLMTEALEHEGTAHLEEASHRHHSAAALGSVGVPLAEMADMQAAVPVPATIEATQPDLLAPLARGSRGPVAVAEPLQRAAETKPASAREPLTKPATQVSAPHNRVRASSSTKAPPPSNTTGQAPVAQKGGRAARADRPAEIRRRQDETDEQFAARQKRFALRLKRLKQAHSEGADGATDRPGSEPGEQAQRLRRRKRLERARASNTERTSED